MLKKLNLTYSNCKSIPFIKLSPYKIDRLQTQETLVYIVIHIQCVLIVQY